MNTELLRRIRKAIHRPVQTSVDDSLLLMGRMASWNVRRMDAVPSLDKVEFKVFSQWGEDGIIDWMIERANIPPHLHSFIEFGVESYVEANTRFLLQNRNWRGLVIDGSPAQIDRLKKETKLFWGYDFTAKTAFITRKNINDLFVEAGFAGEIGLLSIDIDGNDYWVWEAISAINPVICVCEYNAVLGDVWPLSIPYEPPFTRMRPEFKGLYFGASIVALRSLAMRKGYRFLGTNSHGVNAFFVRNDYAARFDCIAEMTAWPSRFRESKNLRGELSFARGLERGQGIRDLPLVNVETLEKRALGEFNPLYSDQWLRILEASLPTGRSGVGPSQ